MVPRLTVLGLVALSLPTAVVLWAALALPPPLWLVKYGPSPGCSPTGEVIEVEGIEFVEVGPGCSLVGSNRNGERGDLVGRIGVLPAEVVAGVVPKLTDEMPVRWVEFPRGFALAATEVTNVQYEAFDPEHVRRERWSPGDDYPVIDVTWEEAGAWCAWLASRSGLAVRLPSAAEWECARRAGEGIEYPSYQHVDDENFDLWLQAYTERLFEVKEFAANPWGLYGMGGNGWEWCRDGEGSEGRIVRGGQYSHFFMFPPTDRLRWDPDTPGVGLRPALAR